MADVQNFNIEVSLARNLCKSKKKGFGVWPGLGVGLGIKGWSWVGLGICKVGGVGSGSDSSPCISCSAVRNISTL